MARSTLSSKMRTGVSTFCVDSNETVLTYGETPEIEAALKQCIEEIWETNPIEESTSTISREHIRIFITKKLNDIEDASLTNEEFDKYYNLVDP